MTNEQKVRCRAIEMALELQRDNKPRTIHVTTDDLLESADKIKKFIATGEKQVQP